MKTQIVFIGLLALATATAGCATSPKENEAAVCSGKNRRPINIYPSALPVIDDAGNVVSANGSASASLPSLDDRISPSGAMRSDEPPAGRGSGQMASLSFASCNG